MDNIRRTQMLASMTTYHTCGGAIGCVACFRERDDRIVVLESQLAERDAQIKRAEALVAARDAQIVERELQIAEMRREPNPQQPERERKLREYATHKLGCRASIRGRGALRNACACGLAELLAAKEGENDLCTH